MKYKLASVSCVVFSNNFGRSGFGETAVAGNSYGTLVGRYTAGQHQHRAGFAGRDGDVQQAHGALLSCAPERHTRGTLIWLL